MYVKNTVAVCYTVQYTHGMYVKNTVAVCSTEYRHGVHLLPQLRNCTEKMNFVIMPKSDSPEIDLVVF